MAPPSQNHLYARTVLTKRTRRNQVVRIVKEHYLRDDIANPLTSAYDSTPGAAAGSTLPHVHVLHGQDCDLPNEGKGGPPVKANKFVVMDASCFPYQVR